MASVHEFSQPSALGALKRSARLLKKPLGIKHSQALEQAARDAGYANHRHALNSPRGGVCASHMPRHASGQRMW